MIQDIKELRIKIDGLAQLVKSLKPTHKYIFDLALIPKDQGIDFEKWLKLWNEEGIALYDGNLKIENNKFDFVKPIPERNKELEKCSDSLLLAKAWLGKVLAELGTKNPYKSGYKTIEDIEPTQDVSSGQGLFKDDFELLFWKELNHIEKVDWLRTKIELVNKELIEVYNDYCAKDGLIEEPLFWLMMYLKTSIEKLSEARFWLGFELQRIKESK